MAANSEMSDGRRAYAKPSLAPLTHEAAPLPADADGVRDTLSGMEVLRVVQTAFDEPGLPRDAALAEVKLRILEEVSAGRLAEAMRLAILAAGERRRSPRF